MTTIHTSDKELPQPCSIGNQPEVSGCRWQVWTAAIGLSAGFIAPLLGSILAITVWINGPVWHGISLRHASTALFLVAIPLLVLGAHCLDLLDIKIDEARHALKTEPNAKRSCEIPPNQTP